MNMYILPPFMDEVLSEEIVKKDNEMGGNMPGGKFPGGNLLQKSHCSSCDVIN